MTFSFEQILGYLSRLSDVFSDADAIFEAAFSMNISQVGYNALKEEYELQNNLYKKE